MGALIQDFRYGLRILRNSPGFATIAVLTLALGVGVNVAIFSFVDELWLRPMPVPQADRLVRIFTSSPTSHGETEQGLNSFQDFEDLRAAKTLSGVALLERRGAMYDDGSQNRLVTAAVLSDNFFEVLQPAPAYGRTFTERELRDFAARPIVISYPFWRRAFNSDPAIVGRTIVLNRQAVLVLCVLPRGFRGTEAFMVPDVWIPYSTWTQMNPGDRHRQTDRGFRDFELFGRLSDKATLHQARAELSGIAGQLAQAYPKTNTGRKITAVYEPDARGEGIASLGLILLGVAGLVLLIACANLASLLIARGESRRRELATRIALGGSRARIVRQLLTETIILAAAGGGVALLLGHLALEALPWLMPQTSFSVGVDAYLSRRGIMVTAGTVVLSLFVFALVPALLATRLAPVAALKLRGSESGRLRAFTRSALVIGQVALSLVLVVSAGLLVRSLWNGLKLDPGFNAHQSMLVVDFSPDLNRDESVRLTEELQRRIEALPGVTGTTVALRVPFGLSGGGMTHKVYVPQAPGEREGATINYAPVGARYFEVLGTRILRGRAIERHDLETQARVLVVNQQMAARFWPRLDPIGQLVRLDKPEGEEYEVIGVAENGKYNDIQEDTMPYFFVPMSPVDYGEVEMAVRTASDPAALAAPFRQALRALNPNAPIVELVTLRDHMREALYIQSATSRLIGTLGLLGLVLVAVGIYGLMSFVVGKRTQEIGVRLALGSQRGAIFRLILRYALRLGVAGIMLGVAASIAAGWALRSLLVGVAPSDPIVLVLGGAVLLVMAVVAALVPALKAVRVDPVVALRDE
jgi:predicted permease